MLKKSIFFIFIFSFLFSIDKNLETVVIVTTGGTIAEKTDPKTGASVPALSGEDFIKSIPELSKMANIKVINFSNIDSSQMTPEIWAKLTKVVDKALKNNKVKGVVVTHGTDTMAEGAYFLELTLKTNKPVVFVGAMKNASDPYSDGPSNLLNGVAQVISKNSYDFGVTVTMNQYINAARNVRKTQTTNLQTFKSGEKGYLGYIFNKKVYRFNKRPFRLKLPIPKNFLKWI